MMWVESWTGVEPRRFRRLRPTSLAPNVLRELLRVSYMWSISRFSPVSFASEVTSTYSKCFVWDASPYESLQAKWWFPKSNGLKTKLILTQGTGASFLSLVVLAVLEQAAKQSQLSLNTRKPLLSHCQWSPKRWCCSIVRRSCFSISCSFLAQLCWTWQWQDDSLGQPMATIAFL